MQVSIELKQKVDARINECLVKIKERYGVEVKRPTISYDIRGRNAGTANYRTWVIQINPVFLAENEEDMLYETVPHELAHLATHTLYPEAHQRGWGGKRRPHGEEWQSIMRAIGVKPSRTHNYNCENLTTSSRSTTYKCINCEKRYQLGPKRVARLNANPRAMFCRCSRGTANLVPANQTVVKPVVTAVQKPVAPVKTTIKPAATGSKMALCEKVYLSSHRVYNRGQMINMFVTQCGCTVAGASTYYSTLKKKFG